MSESGTSEGHSIKKSHDNKRIEEPEIRTLPQEVVNEQIKNFIATLTRQPQDLTWLVQGLSVTSHPNHYPKADTDASYNTHGYFPNTSQEICFKE